MQDPSVAAIHCANALRAPGVAPDSVRRLCYAALGAVTLWLACVGADHIFWQHPDFEYFYKGGLWLAERGALDPGYDLVNGRVEPRGSLDWYWPIVPRVMSLLAVLPFHAAGYLWLALNLVALWAILRLIGRELVGLPPQDWPVTQLLPLVLLAPYWLWEFRLNQIDTLTLLLLVGSFACWQRGRGLVAGFWLGLAVLLKLTPGLLVLWFALKRQYRTVAVAVLTVVLAGPLADAIVFGPTDAAAAYRGWMHRAVSAGSHRSLVLLQRETDWRNQGLGAVLSRWLHPTNYNYRFDNDPRIQRDYVDYPPLTMNVVDLPLPAVASIAVALLGASLIGLVWLARRPAAALTHWQLRCEWALCVLMMLWFMPVMRRYHMICTLPAVAMLGAALHYSGFRGSWARLALAGLGLSAVAHLALFSIHVEARGTVLAALAALALPLVGLLVRLGRHPALLPEPYGAPPHPARPGVTAHA